MLCIDLNEKLHVHCLRRDPLPDTPFELDAKGYTDSENYMQQVEADRFRFLLTHETILKIPYEY